MIGDALIVALFATLLVLEWRNRLKPLRLVATILSLLVILTAVPSTRIATRRAFNTPPAERITIRGGTDYESGVLTMERAVVEGAQQGSRRFYLALGVLGWLALTPVLRDVPEAVRMSVSAASRWYREP